jgi:hypothetical protein
MLSALYILLMIVSTPTSAFRFVPQLDKGGSNATTAAAADEPVEEAATSIPGPALVRRSKPVTTSGTTCVELDMPPRFQWDGNTGEARLIEDRAP